MSQTLDKEPLQDASTIEMTPKNDTRNISACNTRKLFN
jgi:hypothetical protein